MRNKNLTSLIKKNYIKLPMRLVRMNLPAECIAMYVLMVSLPEDFEPSVTFMGRVLKLSKNSVRKYLSIIETCGMIRAYGVRSRGSIVRYEFIKSTDWIKYES